MPTGLIVWTTPGASALVFVVDDVVVDASEHVRRRLVGRSAFDVWAEGRRNEEVSVEWVPAAPQTTYC